MRNAQAADQGSVDDDVKLRVEGLKKHFPVKRSVVEALRRTERDYVKAVDGVTFEIKDGESFGLAGESGCGKTTAGKSAIQLLEPTAGTVELDGRDITGLSKQGRKQLRREAQIIYQDPYESLNPRFTVFDWLHEPLQVHDIGTREERVNRVYSMLDTVNLQPPSAFADKYPPDLSGGERQRVAIARALMLEPSFLLADEPASMLDVSIRARVLSLFEELQADFGLTALYISHDLTLLKHICDRIGIMYLGRIVEIGETEEIINNPQHPYTKALVSNIPSVDPDIEKDPMEIPGEVPDPIDLPSGCRFAPRCPESMDACWEGDPEMYETPNGQEARCILYE